MKVVFHPDAESEHFELPVKERVAVQNVIEKLEAEGLRLGYPHSSQVKGTQLRELRPRGGRSRWRAFYARVRDSMVVLAVGPEAEHDPAGFKKSVAKAEERLGEVKR